MHEPDLIQNHAADGLSRLHLHLVSADICIETRPRDEIRVLAAGIRDMPQLLPMLQRNGDTLTLEGDTESALRLLHLSQRLRLFIQMPVGLALSFRMLSGSVQVNGAFEQVDARVRFGSITGCAPAKRVRIRVFAGDVRLGGLTGAADVQLSLGDVTMAWASLSAGEAVSVRTFAGDNHLDLPDHMALVDGHAAVIHEAGGIRQATATMAASPQML